MKVQNDNHNYYLLFVMSSFSLGFIRRLTLRSTAQWLLMSIISTLSLVDLDYGVKTIRFLHER